MNLQELYSSNGWLLPALIFISVYGGRYLVMALAVSLVARPAADGRGWGRVHHNAPQKFDSQRHIRRELTYSFFTVLIFGMVIATLIGTGWMGSSRFYFQWDSYPAWWFGLSIVVMLLLHDTFFYWIHRVMHWRKLFAVMHKVHHQSVHPTAFAAYSFHPTEALAEALIVTAIIFILPVHPLAFLVFQTLSTAYNVYGHCGREFYPQGMASHRWGRWINTSTAHAAHHGKGRYNYGLYFLFWDRLMGTVDPLYK
ncbi:MAG: sterol desaturase family protein [Burkholderiales bacterium]|nr:sterol desaturase family protein [Burkholderiales bacterium]